MNGYSNELDDRELHAFRRSDAGAPIDNQRGVPSQDSQSDPEA